MLKTLQGFADLEDLFWSANALKQGMSNDEVMAELSRRKRRREGISKQTSDGTWIAVDEAMKLSGVKAKKTVRNAAEKQLALSTDRKSVRADWFARWNAERQQDGRAHAERSGKPVSEIPKYCCPVCHRTQATIGPCKNSSCDGFIKPIPSVR